jgi:hypothetical protein
VDVKEWKRQLSKLFREHPAIGIEASGQFEINLHKGAITKIYRISTETKDGGELKITTKQELK